MLIYILYVYIYLTIVVGCLLAYTVVSLSLVVIVPIIGGYSPFVLPLYAHVFRIDGAYPLLLLTIIIQYHYTINYPLSLTSHWPLNNQC